MINNALHYNGVAAYKNIFTNGGDKGIISN